MSSVNVQNMKYLLTMFEFKVYGLQYYHLPVARSSCTLLRKGSLASQLCLLFSFNFEARCLLCELLNLCLNPRFKRFRKNKSLTVIQNKTIIDTKMLTIHSW